MKKKLVYIGISFVILFLIVRFFSISSSFITKKGIVKCVSTTEHNDVIIELENDSSYYINRGIECGLNIEWFQNYLPGQEVKLHIQNEHLFGTHSSRIIEICINDSCIYTK